MADIEAKVVTENNTKEKLPFSVISNSGQVIAIAAAIAYICGFIVVTAYLGSFGIKDYEAFRIQYMISGTTLLLISGLFFYFVGRHVLTLNEYTKQIQMLFMEKGASGKLWAFCAWIFPPLEIGFLITVTTIIGSSLLFTINSTRLIYWISPTVFGYFWIQFVLTSNAKKDVGKLFFLLIEIFYLLVICAFFYLADGIILKFSYFILSGAFMVNQYLAMKSSVSNPKVFVTYLLICSLVLFSGIFGRYFYGHVRSAVGGGEPESVRVIVDDQNTPVSLNKELNISDSVSSKVDLITQTDSELFLGYPMHEHGQDDQDYKTLIRIDRKLVKALISNDLRVIKYIKTE